MKHGFGKVSVTINLMDTPIGRDMEIGVTAQVHSTYSPATYYDPEYYDQEYEDIEIDKGLSDEDEDVLREWVVDNCDKVFDSVEVDWYEPDYD